MRAFTCEMIERQNVWSRVIPWPWRRSQENRVRSILKSRDPEAVEKAWRREGFDLSSVKQALARVADLMDWQSEAFIPEDSCFVVLRLYESRLIDGLEFTQLTIELEDIFNGSLESAVIPSLDKLTLAQLFGEIIKADDGNRR